MSDTQKNPWYKNLLSQINTMAEQFSLDDIQTNNFREVVLAFAKAQYMAGNKSGIAWVHKQLREKNGGAQAASS